MALKTFCEIASKTLIPSLRALIAVTLIEKYNMTQVEVAKKLGITQPAISYYMHHKRGRKAIDVLKNNDKIRKLVEETVDKIYSETKQGVVRDLFCNLCMKIRNDPDLVRYVEQYVIRKTG